MEIVVLAKENYQGTLHYTLVRNNENDACFITTWGSPNQGYYSYYGTALFDMIKWDHKYNAMVHGKGYREVDRHHFSSNDIMYGDTSGRIFEVTAIHMYHTASPSSSGVLKGMGNQINIALRSVRETSSLSRFYDHRVRPDSITKIDQNEFFTHFTNRVRYPEIYERYCIHTEGENNAESKNSASG